MSKSSGGWLSGLLGILVFSGSMPATRAAVAGFDPFFLTVARATIAGLLAVATLIALRQTWPARVMLPGLVITALGVVVGFPLLTGLALQHITAAHSVAFLGLLPICTAFFGMLRGGERPGPAFWGFSLLGSLCVALYSLSQDAEGSAAGDLLMVAAVVVCGMGYAEGGRLARTLGGWQVICWALVLALPVMAALCLATWPATLAGIPAGAWWGLGYVSLFSMFIGFFFWYHGLARGGIAAVGQLQLMQPILGLIASGLVLHEPIGWQMGAASVAVMACVGAARLAARKAPPVCDRGLEAG